MLHWTTKPEPKSDIEHGTPQEHGNGFGKDSAAVIETRQDSGSHINDVDSVTFGSKPAR